jgi:hypothetical protein
MVTAFALALAVSTAGPSEINPISIAARLSAVITGKAAPIAWEHGWKTDRVIATRYKNPTMGYNIGFKFPQNPNDCDDAELSDFMEANGGSVYESGGHPGAEMFVVFSDVNDKASADKKLQEILPALSQVITDLGNGVKVSIARPKPKYEWPDMAPPDKSNPYWEGNLNMNVNGVQYKGAEVSPGKWQWVIDDGAMKQMADMEAHRRALFWALRSRVLTDDEMREVTQYGDGLNIDTGMPYYAADKAKELNEALLQQQRLRLANPAAAVAP